VSTTRDGIERHEDAGCFQRPNQQFALMVRHERVSFAMHDQKGWGVVSSELTLQCNE
jgi:hypothetical protein